jgi:hypothetical protein
VPPPAISNQIVRTRNGVYSNTSFGSTGVTWKVEPRGLARTSVRRAAVSHMRAHCTRSPHRVKVRCVIVLPSTRLLAVSSMLLLSGCMSFAPVASSRPMSVQHTTLGQSYVLQDNRVVRWGDAVDELEQHETSASDARSAATWATSGSVAWVTGAALAGVGLGASSKSWGWPLVGGGVLVGAGGVWAWSTGTSRMESAVAKYNDALGSTSSAVPSRVRIAPWVSFAPVNARASRPVVGVSASF